MTEEKQEVIAMATEQQKEPLDYIQDVVTGEIRLKKDISDLMRTHLGPINVNPDDIRTIEDFEKSKDKAFAFYLGQLIEFSKLFPDLKDLQSLRDLHRIFLEIGYQSRLPADDVRTMRILRGNYIRTVIETRKNNVSPRLRLVKKEDEPDDQTDEKSATDSPKSEFGTFLTLIDF